MRQVGKHWKIKSCDSIFHTLNQWSVEPSCRSTLYRLSIMPNGGEYETAPPPTRLDDRVQFRVAWTTDRGEVVRFMGQLEYWLDGEWQPVVRYDHDRDAPGGHDVTEEGLHIDIYRDGEKVDSDDVTGPIPADEAFTYAEDDLKDNAEEYVRRFERWHDIRKGNNR